MNKEELKRELENAKFKFWRDEEYHRDSYTNRSAVVFADGKEFRVSLEVLVDYYTVRVVWYLGLGRKASKSYYLVRDISSVPSLADMLTSFVADAAISYGVDLERYTA